MANAEHLAVFKSKMFNDWNRWRSLNPQVVPDLSGEDLTGLVQPYKDLRGANLTEIKLIGAALLGRDFTGANFRRANLHGAKLGLTNLTRADLSGADLADADLSRANLTDADLTGAALVWTTFRGGSLAGADFSNALLLGTVFAEADLSRTRGLGSVRHHSASTIGVETLIASKGEIPESFLRGAGVPESFITHMRSLTGAAFDFYSCFISYSTKDQGFADRLHSDLQAKGVRCWFAPEDLKIGDNFRSRIDESIRGHDKLLLVLSQDSISSPWVEKEVETAFERERRENRIVLFPIRLDDAVIETNEAWAADIRRTRHMGDFTKWEDRVSYAKAFERLLRDLKAQPGDKSAAESSSPRQLPNL